MSSLANIDENFTLLPEFVEPYRTKRVPWGYGALSYVTYKRTYARVKEDGTTEEWWETCKRVIDGMFTIQKRHCVSHRLPWSDTKAREFAEEAYDRLFHFKWTPPGRGLWMMGTDFLLERTGAAANNCAFTSTAHIGDKGQFAHPFGWMFEMSMLGVGVGYDTEGARTRKIYPADVSNETFVVEDSREGWRALLERVLNAFTEEGEPLPGEVDYSQIRPAGSPIKSFGGVASGPDPLIKAVEALTKMYAEFATDEGRDITSQMIVDTMNIAGRCVVAGGVRRTAQIAFGEIDDQPFLDLKLDKEKVMAWRWASNNSVFAHVGMSYDEVAKRTAVNGEPGYQWMENAKAYGRMIDPPNYKDKHAKGCNPCNEQTLWDKELCCLVETYPAHHESFTDYQRTLKIAYQYAKTVTLLPTHDPATNAVMLRNRRIGCSMSGVVQAINKHGYRTFMTWCDKGYKFIEQLDEKYSGWLCIPRSIKMTSVKPSGTVSLLAGATPGVHWDHSPYYIRRVTLGENHPLADMCRDAGYHVEPSVYAPDAVVVEFPIRVDNVTRSKFEVPAREKMDLAADMQKYWSDNQVSCTVEFNPETEGADVIARLLETYETRLKGISLLPQVNSGYEQLPYETITKEQYEEYTKNIKPLRGASQLDHDQTDEFCDGEACVYNPNA